MGIPPPTPIWWLITFSSYLSSSVLQKQSTLPQIGYGPTKIKQDKNLLALCLLYVSDRRDERVMVSIRQKLMLSNDESVIVFIFLSILSIPPNSQLI